ncbi:MAG: hypothetical protein AB7I32_02255 [Gammaproteobacteria bacterium]
MTRGENPCELTQAGADDRDKLRQPLKRSVRRSSRRPRTALPALVLLASVSIPPSALDESTLSQSMATPVRGAAPGGSQSGAVTSIIGIRG